MPQTEPPSPDFDALRALQALHDAMDHMHAKMRQDMDINPTDIRALRMMSVRELKGEPVTPQDLASHLGITTAATTTVIQRLMRHGYLTREVHPGDPRSRILALTAEARTEFFRHFGPHLQTMRTAMEIFSAEELRIAARFMHHLAQQMENPDSPAQETL